MVTKRINSKYRTSQSVVDSEQQTNQFEPVTYIMHAHFSTFFVVQVCFRFSFLVSLLLFYLLWPFSFCYSLNTFIFVKHHFTGIALSLTHILSFCQTAKKKKKHETILFQSTTTTQILYSLNERFHQLTFVVQKKKQSLNK